MHSRLELHLIRWDIKVADWMKRAANQPVHFVKYEEVIADRTSVLQRVLQFIGVDADPTLLTLADERGAFQSMRRQEETHGAESYPGEKGARGYFFVRKGRVAMRVPVMRASTAILPTRSALSEAAAYR